ncbi:four helix bundle protein [Candidatus Saccharibacteria bacterium]|jgi:four helix bundle protein|nr:four helix bundle protein [Candidatus Saccharibacteria bacterium]
MAGKTYKDLIVWQKSFLLAKLTYEITSSLPKSEIYGISSQVQRCAVSIPSNIAEGQQRNNVKEYRHFLGIAKGSSAELETQLLLINDIYKIDCLKQLDLLTEVQKMLSVLIKKLEPVT